MTNTDMVYNDEHAVYSLLCIKWDVKQCFFIYLL